MPRKCIECKKTRPSFGLPEDKVATYCGNCKSEGMVDIRHPRCIKCNEKIPSFGLPQDKVATYCSECKSEGMVDIVHPKCIECKKKQPVFGLPEDRVATYCSECKLEGMVDIKHRRCIECKIKHPNFGLPEDKVATYCGNCKLDGMVDIVNRKCIKCNEKIPSFGFTGDKRATYCNDCKLEGMVNIKSPKCKSDWCLTRVSSKYEGYCMYCFMHLYPDKPVARNYKTKERAVCDYIKETFSDIDLKTDQRIQGGCSNRRPDVFIDLGYQIIIVEIDENQHIDYDCSCENKRLMLLSQDVGYRPIIFIRFNPDSYISKEGSRISSCWSMNGKGVCQVGKKQLNNWNHRLNVLKDTIEYWLDIHNKTDKTIEVIQLFYDEY